VTVFCVRVRDTLAFCACATDLGIIILQLSSRSSNLQITSRAFIHNFMSYTLSLSGRAAPYFTLPYQGPIIRLDRSQTRLPRWAGCA